MNALRQPPFLKSLDTIGLVATAKKISLDEVQFAVNLIESWGLKVKIGKSLTLADHQFAGSDKERASDLQSMLDDENIKAILCARGGYGTVRIIDHIDFTKFLRNPKWICGYSDITVLHCHINYALAVQTIHCTMPINFETNTHEALDSLRKALFGEPIQYRIPSHSLNRPGKVESIMSGGNLSIIYSLCGSSTVFSLSNHILLLEDLDEYLYHIDRMMMNLKRGGKLNKLSAVIVGAFTDMKDNAIPFGKDAFHIIKAYTDPLQIPVCFDFPAGHIADNRAIIFGKKATLSIDEKQTSLQF